MESLQKVPMGLLTAYTIKLLFTGVNPSEMGVVFALSAGLIAFEYLAKSRKLQAVLEANKEFQSDLSKQVADQVHVINKQNDVIQKLAIELQECRNGITSLKASSGLKKVSG